MDYLGHEPKVFVKSYKENQNWEWDIIAYIHFMRNSQELVKEDPNLPIREDTSQNLVSPVYLLAN